MSPRPTIFDTFAMARRGDLELRIERARERLGRHEPIAAAPVRKAGDFKPSPESERRTIALCQELIAVIDRHANQGDPSP